jgi:signal transduction histidine kinase
VLIDYGPSSPPANAGSGGSQDRPPPTPPAGALSAICTTELKAHLDEVGAEVIGTLDELRELARGIHPSVLAKGGLRPALNTLARRSAVPVDLRIDGRLPEQIEVAAYYVVSEALTNVAKHAHASTVHVEVDTGEGDAVLRVLVRDDGRGGADLSGGTCLVGLKDRVEALSGRLSVQTDPGTGTTV